MCDGQSWFQLILAGVLGLLLTQFAFLSHEAAHRQILSSGPANDRLGCFLGTDRDATGASRPLSRASISVNVSLITSTVVAFGWVFRTSTRLVAMDVA